MERHRLSIRVRALWGRRASEGVALTPYRAPKNNEEHSDGFRIASFYDSEDQWLNVSEEYNSRFTPEMQALMTVPNYDSLE